MNDLTLCMRILCLSQSVINTTDELTDRVIFKHKFKQQTKSYLKVVEGMVDDLAKAMDIKDMDEYSKIVKSLDDLVATIEITN
jgi:hypothetical protein